MIRLIQPCDKHQFEKFSEGCTTGQVTWKCKVCGYEETRWPASFLQSIRETQMASEIANRLRNLNPWGEPGWPEDIKEAVGHIEALEAALQQCQSVLAMFIHPDTIMETTVLNAYALATAAEAKARALLSPAAPAAAKPFTFADPARQREWEKQRRERE